MKYETPEVDFIIFEQDDIFMTASGNGPISCEYTPSSQTPTSAREALDMACGGYNGAATNNFSCSDFGGYNASNPPTQNAQVTIAGTSYVFDYKGNHWKQHKGNN